MVSPPEERISRSLNSTINAMTGEERAAYMRELGRRGNAGRLTLSAEERAGLTEAYRLLDRIAKRHGIDLVAPLEGEGRGDA